MRTKFLMLFVILSAFFTLPSFGQITEENLDFQSRNDAEIGPVSLGPVYVSGVLSHVNKTIDVTFEFDLGYVTFWITDEKGQLWMSEEVNATKNGYHTFNINQLPNGQYNIICFIPNGPALQAKFKLQ